MGEVNECWSSSASYEKAGIQHRETLVGFYFNGVSLRAPMCESFLISSSFSSLAHQHVSK